jgi:ankyrin repeat protein
VAAAAVAVSEAAIIECCEAGDLGRLRRWACQGVQVVNDEPLCVAVRSWNTDVMRCLVNEMGADVDLADGNDRTRLQGAARLGDLVLLRFLVNDLGADPNLASKEGFTPLMIAA